MNTMRRWITLLLAMGMVLPFSALSASARVRPRDYIGVYRRSRPGRRGTATVFMDVGPRGRVVIRTIRPNGSRGVTNGTWHFRNGNLIVDTNRGMQVYRLHGSNLERADDPHIFFKKQ